MTKSKIDFRHLIIEAVMIVFTVLLALALSEWRSSTREAQTREAVLSNIILEIKNNKKDLESKMDYHLKMSQKLGAYLNSDSLWSTLQHNSGIEVAMQLMGKGIQNPDLQSGAWKSAELSGVVNSFEYGTLYLLSNVYRIQEDGPNSTWKQMAKLFSDPSSYDKDSARRICLMMQLAFKELYSQERSLVSSYENALKALRDEK